MAPVVAIHPSSARIPCGRYKRTRAKLLLVHVSGGQVAEADPTSHYLEKLERLDC